MPVSIGAAVVEAGATEAAVAVTADVAVDTVAAVETVAPLATDFGTVAATLTPEAAVTAPTMEALGDAIPDSLSTVDPLANSASLDASAANAGPTPSSVTAPGISDTSANAFNAMPNTTANPINVANLTSGATNPGVDLSAYPQSVQQAFQVSPDALNSETSLIPDQASAVQPNSPPDSSSGSPLDWFNSLSSEAKAQTLQALGSVFKGVWDARSLTALQQLKNEQMILQQQRGDQSVAGLNIQPGNIASGGLIANNLNGGYTTPAAGGGQLPSIGGLPSLPGILGQNPNLNPATRTG
jgi:hypothetical protein